MRGVKSQHRIDDSPCFPAFTGVGEFVGELRASSSPRFVPTLPPGKRARVREALLSAAVAAGGVYAGGEEEHRHEPRRTLP